MCTYAYFKSGPSNAHLTVPHFFTDKPSHLLYDIVGQMRVVEGFICKKKSCHHWMSIGRSRFKICICAQELHMHMIHSHFFGAIYPHLFVKMRRVICLMLKMR
jgi:hypothetical protein